MTYRITKYAQSCILIEKDGKRCLIDPGRFVYEMDSMKPSDWPKIDVILITHEHPDHAQVEGITFIVERDDCPVVTNRSFADSLRQQGLPAAVCASGQQLLRGGFEIDGIAQTHPELDGGRIAPEVIGFLVDRTFYTPGDSVVMPEMPHADVLFVSIAGPHMDFSTARVMIKKVNPGVAIPMHYANTAKYPIDEQVLNSFSVEGTRIMVMKDKESFEWSEHSK